MTQRNGEMCTVIALSIFHAERSSKLKATGLLTESLAVHGLVDVIGGHIHQWRRGNIDPTTCAW